MPAGRPKKPLELHRLADTKSKAAPVVASQIQAGRPKFPKNMSAAARREFKSACRLLEARRCLTPGDVELLFLFAELKARWTACISQIGDQFMVRVEVLDSNGAPITKMAVHPLLKVAQNCETRLAALAKSLGLTPVDRDKPKPTSADLGSEIVKGSIADTHPELLIMPSPNDLATEDAKERGSE